MVMVGLSIIDMVLLVYDTSTVHGAGLPVVPQAEVSGVMPGTIRRVQASRVFFLAEQFVVSFGLLSLPRALG